MPQRDPFAITIGGVDMLSTLMTFRTLFGTNRRHEIVPVSGLYDFFDFDIRNIE